MNDQTAPPDVSTQVATVDRHVWATLQNSLYPGAKDDSIRMVLSYCKARGLDPMKKPCHIVPMKVKNAQGHDEWRDVIFPGIYELRTTAQKTGDYMGQDDAEFGDTFEYLGQEVPQWCKITVYRLHEKSGEKISYSARVMFSECCGTRWKDQKEELNQRWKKAPYQMIEKCAEAAALRKAFPDELGGEMAAEEMHGAATPVDDPLPGKPVTAAPQSTAGDNDDTSSKKCTRAQADLIQKRLDEEGVPERELLQKFGVDHIDFIKFDDVDNVLAWISSVNEPPGS